MLKGFIQGLLICVPLMLYCLVVSAFRPQLIEQAGRSLPKGMVAPECFNLVADLLGLIILVISIMVFYARRASREEEG